MARPVHSLAIALVAAPLAALSQQASAGIGAVITYGPGAATAVPALGGYALVALAGLLALVAYRLRGEGALRENRFLGLALFVAVVATGASGAKLVYAVNFGPAPGVPLNQASGGEANVGTGTSCLYNQTEGELAITAITPSTGAVIDSLGTSKDGTCPETYIDNGGVNAGEAPVCSASPSTVLGPQKACSVTVLPQDPG